MKVCKMLYLLIVHYSLIQVMLRTVLWFFDINYRLMITEWLFLVGMVGLKNHCLLMNALQVQFLYILFAFVNLNKTQLPTSTALVDQYLLANSKLKGTLQRYGSCLSTSKHYITSTKPWWQILCVFVSAHLKLNITCSVELELRQLFPVTVIVLHI